jgi:hypothetical protein
MLVRVAHQCWCVWHTNAGVLRQHKNYERSEFLRNESRSKTCFDYAEYSKNLRSMYRLAKNDRAKRRRIFRKHFSFGSVFF